MLVNDLQRGGRVPYPIY